MPSPKPRVSPTMLDALALAADGGLVRFPGGFWIAGNTRPVANARGCPCTESGDRLPHVPTQTVYALENRALVVLDPEDNGRDWKRRRILTDLGAKVLADYRPATGIGEGDRGLSTP